MTKFVTKHASWDGGSISENPLFLATIGPQKTIKTRCNKRVGMVAIDNHNITCATCLDDINRQDQAMERLVQYDRVVKTQGREAANALAATWETI